MVFKQRYEGKDCESCKTVQTVNTYYINRYDHIVVY